jgi:NAD(P)-dependent dehydrogenase (short-subunit alcohol dehydrogenase family)
VLVNNGALGGNLHPIHLKPLSEFDTIMAVNVRGAYMVLQAAIRIMLKGGGGSIINVASVDGIRGTRRASAYSMSKHALIGMTRCAAMEYASDNIRVNSLSPGGSEQSFFVQRNEFADNC